MDLPVTVSSIGVVVVPLFWIISTFTPALAPAISPLSWTFWILLKDTVTLIALTEVLETALVIGFPNVTATPTEVSVSIFAIPPIKVWFEVPNLGSKPTSLKLNCPSSGAVLLAAVNKSWVPLRNISFLKALLYAVVPWVRPAFDAVADPSISPSPTTSTRVLNCFEDKVSEGNSGFVKTVCWLNYCMPAIMRHLLLVLYQYH